MSCCASAFRIHALFQKQGKTSKFPKHHTGHFLTFAFWCQPNCQVCIELPYLVGRRSVIRGMRKAFQVKIHVVVPRGVSNNSPDPSEVTVIGRDYVQRFIPSDVSTECDHVWSYPNWPQVRI